ncbi:MAG: M56 family metallopeptidase [Pirellulales bacterium]
MPGLLEIGLVNAAVATALALLAAVASLVCRRPPVVYCLWLLVLVKLITPPLVRLPVELTGLVARQPAQRPSTQTAGGRHEVGGEQLRGIAPAAPAAKEVGVANGSASFPVTRDSVSSAPFEQIYGDYRVTLPEDHGAELLFDEGSTVSRWRTLPWALLIGGAWLAGSCGWWLLVAIRIARFGRLLRYSQPACERLQAEASALSRRLGLSRPPELRLIGGRVPPLLWALGRQPVVLLPHALLDRLDRQQQATLLAHELAHLRRRDHWVRWLELVVLGLYWWHPVAWWARRRFQQAEEQCCDAWVLWALPGLARTYAKALLETVEFLSEVRPVMPPAASGLGQVYLLKRRFAMILHDRWSPALSRPMRLAMLGVGLLALGISPWPLRVVAQPPADLDPAAAQAADLEAAAADESALAPADTADDAIPAVDPAAADEPGSIPEAEGEATVEVPVVVQGVRRSRTAKVTYDPSRLPAARADDIHQDIHQRLDRLEQMVQQLVKEMRRTRDTQPSPPYRPADLHPKPRYSDFDFFSPDPEARKPSPRREARAQQLRREREQLRARLEEIDRELAESAPVKR